jgi:hypothetical protein
VTGSGLGSLPPAIARVDCGEDRHTIRWEAGQLVALDHGDPDAERALAALGGQSFTCVDILSAWARARHDRRLLSALTRGLGDPMQADPAHFPPGQRGNWGRGAGSSTSGGRTTSSARLVASSVRGPSLASERPTDDEFRLLATLGHDLAFRMAATVTVHLLEEEDAPPGTTPPRAALEASLWGRVASTLRTWLGNPTLKVVLDVIEPDQPCAIEQLPDHQLRVALPLRWVADVWARDVALVAGRFSLSIIDASAQEVLLETIGPDLGPPRPLRIEWT